MCIEEKTIQLSANYCNGLKLASGDFIYEGKKYHLAQKNEATFKVSLDFAARRVGNEIYLYGIEKCNALIEWVKAIGMIFANIIHTIVYKIGFLLLWGKGLKKLVPLRALAIFVPQFLVNLSSILTFGLFSTWFNRISGDLERWCFGVSKKSLVFTVLNKRLKENIYAAPCQQPKCIIKNFTENKSLDMQEVIPIHQWRSMLPMLIHQSYFEKCIPSSSCNFSNR